ncbi:hypothetical protein EB796_021891 [Bugula neritina]|uniref:METTL17 n=1 Tax=Bugula neritina TaxID=10212 RepID=A0A7J7J295_BUGNE|nr:hypothetical protein EB796_021891 [Bugula neritina]
MRRHLWNKRVPMEQDEMKKIGQELEYKLTSAKLQQTSSELLNEEEIEKEMAGIRKIALQQMKKSIYNWRPLHLDAYLSVVYMSSHLLSNYAVWYSIMSEISAIDPEFRPQNVLDFGSGLATSVWAINEIWTSVNEHYCWDHSVDVCTLARLLLQEGKADADMVFPGVYFRQQLDKEYSKKGLRFDLVLSGHTLLELPTKKTRLQHIDKLWTQTKDYLILVEIGTPHGHSLIEEARLHILNTYKNTKHSGHVFAPCPHEKPCPVVSERSKACSFEVTYKVGPSQVQKKKVFLESESKKEPKQRSKKGTSVRYCYVVLKKGNLAEEPRAPRCLSNANKQKSSVQCQLCFPDGRVGRAVFTQSQNVGNLVRLAKRSVLGTRLPITGWNQEDLDASSSNATTSDSSVTDSAEHIDSECSQGT